MVGHQFFIELDNPTRSFFAYQPVTGRVILETLKERKTEGIQVVFQGGASVHWTESHEVTTGTGDNRETRTETRVFSSEEPYFDCKINLIGNASREIIIPPGRHTYPFQFVLPPNLPSSFVGAHGRVLYSITAKMQRSWRFDYKAVVPFTVNAIVDLNRDSRASMAIDGKKEKNVCCLCCKSGPLGFIFKICRSGFVPGEDIQITCELYNESSTKVKKAKLSLHQDISFHAQGSTKHNSQLLGSVIGPAVERGEREPWLGRVMQIPPVPPTALGGCRIIDVQYYLMFEMELSGMSINLKEKYPVVIGTIPLRNTFFEFGFHNNPQQPLPAASPSCPAYSDQEPQLPGFDGPALPIPSAPAFDEYPDLPPPSYAEAVSFKGGDPVGAQSNVAGNQENDPAGNYMPNYITYGWKPHMQNN